MLQAEQKAQAKAQRKHWQRVPGAEGGHCQGLERPQAQGHHTHTQVHTQHARRTEVREAVADTHMHMRCTHSALKFGRESSHQPSRCRSELQVGSARGVVS